MENMYTFTSRLVRLYQFLAYVKHFPIPLRFAAITAGLDEETAASALDRTPYLAVGDQIIPRSELEKLEELTIHEADMQYHTKGLIIVCHDGRPIQQYKEESAWQEYASRIKSN